MLMQNGAGRCPVGIEADALRTFYGGLLGGFVGRTEPPSLTAVIKLYIDGVLACVIGGVLRHGAAALNGVGGRLLA
ncbi:hypothetical protein LAN14_24580, partial [Mycobacterium tuberculosis]|nr:hypothetical protein [Mycobacterium tuberculosis]